MKWIVTGIRYIQEYCLFFSFDCCCKGVITFSCLPGSSQRMLPLFQYFDLHGGDKASAAGRKKKLQKKKNVSQVLETKLSFSLFQDPDRKMRACGGAQSGFFNKGKLVILRNATTL